MVNITSFGDWHGNKRYALKALSHAVLQYPESYFVHQGDFGFTDTKIYKTTPGTFGDIEMRGYVHEINAYLESVDKDIYVVLGNHENYPAIDTVFGYHGLYNNSIDTTYNKDRVVLKQEYLCLNEDIDDSIRKQITMYRFLYDKLTQQGCFLHKYSHFYDIIDFLVDKQDGDYTYEGDIVKKILRTNNYNLFYDTFCQEGDENNKLRKVSPFLNLLTENEREFFDSLWYYQGCIDIDDTLNEKGQLLYISGDERISDDYYDDNGFITSSLFPRIKIIPRGHTWVWDNARLTSFGGALSINRKHVERMINWCEEETPTDEQKDRFLQILPEKVDVLFTHDIPQQASSILYSHKDQKSLSRSWGQDIVQDNTKVTSVIQEVADFCNPDRIVSGHHHKRKDITLDNGTLVNILNCDGPDISENHINFNV